MIKWKCVFDVHINSLSGGKKTQNEYSLIVNIYSSVPCIWRLLLLLFYEWTAWPTFDSCLHIKLSLTCCLPVFYYFTIFRSITSQSFPLKSPSYRFSNKVLCVLCTMSRWSYCWILLISKQGGRSYSTKPDLHNNGLFHKNPICAITGFSTKLFYAIKDYCTKQRLCM